MDAAPTPVRPRFRSLSLYNDTHGRLSFWYPADWHMDEQTEPQARVTLWPQALEPLTHIHIELQDLGRPVEASEYPLLCDGVREGLALLPDCTVRAWGALADEGNREWGLQWHCTFRLDETTCVRTARMFVYHQFLYTITFQGMSQARFDYWKDMFEYIMLTVGPQHFSGFDWIAQYQTGVLD